MGFCLRRKRKRRPFRTAAWYSSKKADLLLLEREPAEALVELGNAATLVHLALAAGPRRMADWVDVERQRVAFLAPGGAGFEHGAVSHLHLDHVVLGVGLGLHGKCVLCPCSRYRPAWNVGKARG